MFFKDLGLGSKNFFKAINFMFKHGLWWYYLIPLTVSILLSVGSFYIIDVIVDSARDFSAEFLHLDADVKVEVGGIAEVWETIKAFLNGARDILIIIVFKVIFWYIFFKVNKYVVLIVLSPVMAYLSEKTEEILTATEYPFDIMQFTREVWRGVLIAIRNMIIELGIVVSCWVITLFLPFLAPFTAIFLFFVGAYYYGFSMIDYVNERKRLNISQSVHYIRKNKGVAIGNGSIFAVLMWIPFLGFIVAPITGSVGAVLAIHEKRELGSQYARPKVSSVQPPVS